MKGPSVEEIDAILERTTESAPAELRAVVDGKRLLEMRQIAGKVSLAAAGRRWVASLVAATHPDFPQAPEAVKHYVRYGASPRAAQSMVMAAKVRAAANGRTEVAKEDFAATIVAGAASPHPAEFRGPGREHPPRGPHRQHREELESVDDSHRPEA